LTSTILEQIRSIASDLFSIAPVSVTVESSPENIEAWDSTQHLNLVLAIEEKFHLQLSPEEIEQMHSIGAIAKLVESRLQTARR
jgi:acyl carrier protein